MDDVLKSLRTPRGMAWLFGVTLVLALALALVMAHSRWFFERYVREKYPTPSSTAVEMVVRIRMGNPGPRIEERLKAHCADAYSAWMTADRTDGDEPLARAIVASDPALIATLLEKTFAAGSQAQKLRAARLAHLGAREELVPVLEWARARAEATRNAELTGAIRAALAARAAHSVGGG